MLEAAMFLMHALALLAACWAAASKASMSVCKKLLPIMDLRYSTCACSVALTIHCCTLLGKLLAVFSVFFSCSAATKCPLDFHSNMPGN